MTLLQKLQKINTWGAVAVLFAPLLANANFIFPYIFLKNSFFRAVILLLIITLVWQILLQGKIIWRRQYILWAFLSFLLVQLLSSIFGINPYNSFFGNTERMDGFFNLLFLGIYLFLLLNVFRKKEDWILLLRGSVICSALISLYALLRLGDVSISFLLAKNSSTIGNTAFLGSYLMLNIFFTAVLAYWDGNKKWRIYYYGALVLNVLVLFINASRGSILGLLIGAFIFGGLYCLKSTRKIKISFFSAIIFLIIFSMFVFWQKDASWVQHTKFLKRLTDISTQDYSTNNRLLIWGVAFDAFKSRPILGYGPENAYYGLNKYYNPAITEQWFDRSHNFIFDYLDSSGALGLLSYLAIFAVTLLMLVKNLKKNYVVSALLIAFFAAYLFSNLFVFDTINTWLLIITALAVVSFFAGEQDGREVGLPGFFSSLYYPIIGLSIFSAIVFGYFMVLRPWQANLSAANALRHYNSDGEKVLAYYDRAISYNSFGKKEFTLQLAKYAIGVINGPEPEYQFKKKAFEQTEKRMLAVLKNDGQDIRARLVLAELYRSYSQYNTFYIKESIIILENNIADSPRRPAVYSSLAQSYYLDGDLEKSLELLEKIIMAGSARDGDYTNVINIATKLKNVDKTEYYINEYFNNFKNISSENYRIIAQDYFAIGKIDKAEDVLVNYSIPADPNNMAAYVSLASLYDNEKKYQKAYDVIDGVIASHPEWKNDLADYASQLKAKINPAPSLRAR